MSSKNLLVEIGTEELPPKALKNLAKALHQGIVDGLKSEQLSFQDSQWYASPRRLAVIINDLSESAPDQEVEIHGPPADRAKDSAGNWTPAASGFAKKNGIAPEQLETVDTAKGPRLAYKTVKPGANIQQAIQPILDTAVQQLPIPKRMRWGASRSEFIRPVHSLIVLFGETLLPCSLFSIPASNTTAGHRIHCKQALTIKNPDEYLSVLKDQGYVLADYQARQALIKQQVIDAGNALNGQAIIDEDLLDEVTSLVEWPVALSGRFEERFLDVPAEALVSSMKEHQKYFHVVDGDGKLLPYFITVANLESKDQQKVIEGNEKVIRPRLADAAFFWETDKKQTLESRLERLKSIVYQEKLGTLYDKSMRIEAIAHYLAKAINTNEVQASRAARLCKTDLVTEMVFEFDDMQGIAGYHYALNDGEDEAVAAALLEQYLPKFAGDAVPDSLVGACVAIADRIDTLTGIFGIGQQPTGSKDPFALRRASLGVLRILVEKQLAVDLRQLLAFACNLHNQDDQQAVSNTVFDYMIERFRAWFEEENIPVEVFNAVTAKQVTVPLEIQQRVHAVHAFSQHPNSSALAAANKRVANILSKQAEDSAVSSEIDPTLLQEDAEKSLAALIDQKVAETQPLIEQRNYTAVLAALSELRDVTDQFFDNVMVMADDEKVRNNRIALLSKLRNLFLQVADISQLASTL